jgi:hypothetical protein
MDEVPQHDMQTTRITAMTLSFAKRVGAYSDHLARFLTLAVCVSSLMISEIKRIIKDSEIMKEDDSKWPQKNKDGRQELEIRLGSDHIQFEVWTCVSLLSMD